MEPQVRPAQMADLASVKRLLTSVDLTVAGVRQHLPRFLVAEDAGEIVACAGLEIYGPHALLRSVAVHPRARNRGLGTSLVSYLVDRARREGVRSLYLLTTTAEEYFRRLGFDTLPREDVDPAVRQSTEFGDAACASARAMVLKLASGTQTLAAAIPTGGVAMKYSVEGDGSLVQITIKGVGSKQAELLKELNECAEGRCSCPTDQYAKVESMQITPGDGQLSIMLSAKSGEKIDQGDINKCLEHTTQKVKKSG